MPLVARGERDRVAPRLPEHDHDDALAVRQREQVLSTTNRTRGDCGRRTLPRLGLRIPPRLALGLAGEAGGLREPPRTAATTIGRGTGALARPVPRRSFFVVSLFGRGARPGARRRAARGLAGYFSNPAARAPRRDLLVRARLRPRPVDGGLRRFGRPEAPLLAARIGERRPVWAQANSRRRRRPASRPGTRSGRWPRRRARGSGRPARASGRLSCPSLLGLRSTRRISASRLGGVHRPAPAVVLDRHDPRLLGPQALGVGLRRLQACRTSAAAMVPSGPTRLTARHVAPVLPSPGQAGAARPRSATGPARRASWRARVHRHALAVVRHLHDPQRPRGPGDVGPGLLERVEAAAASARRRR